MRNLWGSYDVGSIASTTRVRILGPGGLPLRGDLPTFVRAGSAALRDRGWKIAATWAADQPNPCRLRWPCAVRAVTHPTDIEVGWSCAEVSHVVREVGLYLPAAYAAVYANSGTWRVRPPEVVSPMPGGARAFRHLGSSELTKEELVVHRLHVLVPFVTRYTPAAAELLLGDTDAFAAALEALGVPGAGLRAPVWPVPSGRP